MGSGASTLNISDLKRRLSASVTLAPELLNDPDAELLLKTQVKTCLSNVRALQGKLDQGFDPSSDELKEGIVSLRRALRTLATSRVGDRPAFLIPEAPPVMLGLPNLIMSDKIIPESVSAVSIREQIKHGFEKRQTNKIREVFKKFSEYRVATSSCYRRDKLGRYQQVRPHDFAFLIPKTKLRESLETLHVTLNSEAEIETLFFVMDLDDNKGLDEEEFRRALQASSQFITSLGQSRNCFEPCLCCCYLANVVPIQCLTGPILD